MHTLDTLKRNIDSARELESVVRTMKTLSAVSIRQYERAVESLMDYYRTVEDGLQMILWRNAELTSRGDSFTAAGPVGAVVFGSDQGMCGQFNERIVDFTLQQLGQDAGSEPSPTKGRVFFLAIGARATARLLEAGLQVDSEQAVPGSATGITFLVQELLPRIETWRTRRGLGRVVLFYHRRISASAYRPQQVRLLPVDAAEFIHPQRRWPSRTLPTFTMEPSRLLSSLLRQYLFVLLFRACAESQAAENASRIASMQSAEQNIRERLDELELEYHQLRQTAITEELLEVVSGFETLVGEDRGAKTAESGEPRAESQK